MKIPFVVVALSLAVLLAGSPVSPGQAPAKKASVAGRAGLEKELWDADQQWLCSSGAGPYHKD